jgi:hypothetical protein
VQAQRYGFVGLKSSACDRHDLAWRVIGFVSRNAGRGTLDQLGRIQYLAGAVDAARNQRLISRGQLGDRLIGAIE